MADPIKASGRSEAILGVVERFGDRACQFLWRHKGTIFVAAVLTAFLADPQPYIDGVKQLVVEPASRAAEGAVGRTNWTLVFLGLGLAVLAGLSARHVLRARRTARKGA
jgi:hypothetical protein